MTLGVYASVSFCFSPSPRPVLVFSTGGSSLLGFPPLTWFSCLGLGLGAFLSFFGRLWRGSHSSFFFCSLLGLLFLPPVPHWCCFFMGGCCLPSCLSLRSLPSWASVSLVSVSFSLFLCSGALLLLSCPSPCLFVLLACILLSRYFLSSLGFGLLFVLVPLLLNSVESQFLRDGVLPLGHSIGCCVCVCFMSWLSLSPCHWSSSGSGRWFSSSSTLGWVVFPLVQVHSVGFLSFSLFMGVSAFPCGAGFLSLLSLLSSLAFPVCLRSLPHVCVVMCLGYAAVAVCC